MRILLLLSTIAIAQAATPWTSALRYRMVGPLRGGRVTTVTGVPSQPFTYYMGSTGGGVWKTTDAGHNWANVSDNYFAVASMGAVEVSLSNPDIVYAGTGSEHTLWLVLPLAGLASRVVARRPASNNHRTASSVFTRGSARCQ